MTVEGNYTTGIATLSDWLNKFTPVFPSVGSKAPCARDFSRTLSNLQVMARISNWFITLFTPVMISRSNCFGLVFSTVICKPRVGSIYTPVIPSLP